MASDAAAATGAPDQHEHASSTRARCAADASRTRRIGGSEEPAGELAPVLRGAGVVGPISSSRSTNSWRASSSSFTRSSRRGELGVVVVVRRQRRRRAGPAPRPGAPRRSRGCGPAPPAPPRTRPARRAARPAPTTAASLSGSSSRARRRLTSSPASTSAATVCSSSVGSSRSTNCPHLVLGVGAEEAVDGLAVLQRDDERDALDAERLGDAGVLVDVDLHQHDLAVGLVDDLLDDRPEGAARTAPRRPEVDDDRHLLRALDHLGLEGGIGDVEGHEERRYRWRVVDPPGVATVAVVEAPATARRGAR